jgi:very-short-patch-repair endonuclease
MVLRREGFRVLRFWSSTVMRETDEVMDTIVLALESALPGRKAD